MTVRTGGRVWLGDEDAGTMADLGTLRVKIEEALSLRAGNHPAPTVFVQVPRSLMYSDVLRVLEAARRAGATQLGWARAARRSSARRPKLSRAASGG